MSLLSSHSPEPSASVWCSLSRAPSTGLRRRVASRRTGCVSAGRKRARRQGIEPPRLAVRLLPAVGRRLAAFAPPARSCARSSSWPTSQLLTAGAVHLIGGEPDSGGQHMESRPSTLGNCGGSHPPEQSHYDCCQTPVLRLRSEWTKARGSRAKPAAPRHWRFDAAGRIVKCDACAP